MSQGELRPLTRETLLDYFLQAATPRDHWQVGMELEKLGRRITDGRPIPYDSTDTSVRAVLELIRDHRGGEPVLEGDFLIGLDAPWGSISLEPGGQVEWSSRPQKSLPELEQALEGHLAMMRQAGTTLGIEWLETAMDPLHAVADMPWMPKARYKIMRPFLGSRGRLAHRMMTQTASIQCAFDYCGPEDWSNKFRASAMLAPVAVALFGNSAMVDGRDTGYRSYRQVIWRETDPDRCGLPPVVFAPGFDLDAWLGYVLEVPTMFLHRSHGLVAAGGIPFVELMQRTGCDTVKLEDWETHISTIFTEVRSYNYIEVRSADLVPDRRVFSVPCFWTGLLYHDAATEAGIDLVASIVDHAAWLEAMESASRFGLEGAIDGRPIRDLAAEALAISIEGIAGGAACTADGSRATEVLRDLARDLNLSLRV